MNLASMRGFFVVFKPEKEVNIMNERKGPFKNFEFIDRSRLDSQGNVVDGRRTVVLKPSFHASWQGMREGIGKVLNTKGFEPSDDAGLNVPHMSFKKTRSSDSNAVTEVIIFKK